MEMKVRKWGNSVGLLLDKEVRAHLGGIEAGDRVFAVTTPDGIRLTPYDPDFARQMEVARGVMRRRRNALRELAK